MNVEGCRLSVARRYGIRAAASTLTHPYPRLLAARNAAFPEGQTRVPRRKALPPSTPALPLRARPVRARGNALPPSTSARFLQANATRLASPATRHEARRAWVPSPAVGTGWGKDRPLRRRDAETWGKTGSSTASVGSRKGVVHWNPTTDARDGPKHGMPCMARERQRRDTLQPGATPRVGPPTTHPSPERAAQTMGQGHLPAGPRREPSTTHRKRRGPQRLRASAGDLVPCK